MNTFQIKYTYKNTQIKTCFKSCSRLHHSSLIEIAWLLFTLVWHLVLKGIFSLVTKLTCVELADMGSNHNLHTEIYIITFIYKNGSANKKNLPTRNMKNWINLFNQAPSMQVTHHFPTVLGKTQYNLCLILLGFAHCTLSLAW